MATYFGYYRGEEVSILHMADNADGFMQLPLLCKIRNSKKNKEHYINILSMKLKPGFTSKLLCLAAPSKMKESLLGFKRKCRHRLAMRRIRQQVRARKIHEELVAAVWHPRHVERWLETGGWPLVAMIAGDEGLI